MQIPLQITFKNMTSSPAIEGRIREKARKLERFSDRIAGCHVVVEAPHRHQRTGKLYQVSIDITVPPKGDLIVNREHRRDHAHEDVNVAIRDAFDAAVRQLEDHARKVRGETKMHELPLHGRVVRLFPDYGFVETSNGLEVYFHRNSVVNNGFDALEAGTEVRLVLAENESAQGPQATTVQHIGKHHLVE
jgi:ribosomal subunit interface protein